MIVFFGDLAAHGLLKIVSTYHDKIVINLEGPITTTYRRKGIRPRLSSSTTNISQLDDTFESVHYSVVNNHIKDYGKYGYRLTQKILGKRMLTANASLLMGGDEILYLMNIGSLSIGCSSTISLCIENRNILNKAENYFSDKDGIKVIMIHAGVEFTNQPQPYLVRLCRDLASYCDYIIIAHSHIIGPFEKHKGCKIFYGIGNFFIDMDEFQDSDDYRYPEESSRGIGIGIVSKKEYALFECCRKERTLFIERNDTSSIVDISGQSIDVITANYKRKKSFLAFDYPQNINSWKGLLYAYYLLFRHEVILATKLLLKYVRNSRSFFKKN